jgi:hypothetical protein
VIVRLPSSKIDFEMRPWDSRSSRIFVFFEIQSAIAYKSGLVQLPILSKKADYVFYDVDFVTITLADQYFL